MKNLLFFTLILFGILSSCNKKESCKDPNALNSEITGGDNSICRYTNVIFYAGSNRVGGNGDILDKIEVYRIFIDQEELVGTISDLKEFTDAPIGCANSLNSIRYELNTSTDIRFTTKYYYKNATAENGGTHIFKAASDQECIVQNLTL
ncbi:hypothetical protein KMW28_21465 [Flammeovirga yaeyamensis]|uniref:Lipoprotein n=1 Tax=Flammeovirga yaeyamensis TaxID=367791 RepID=A0AAX1NBP1_9BACT|nr:hypothetical protein [Flammeovirga yaeyamensis]MBB3697078.1 hypothetical protein [Flammeovirga yaeyamensis]NMF33740.1 hypothetical protein [Flammeovirga yaeyamensis]QWG04994.1 hypothetical protein KMW28_21465 [Flammeovirga yaeyamensis]